MIAVCAAWDQGALAALLDHDPVVRRYRAFFAHLDWTVIPARDPARPWPVQGCTWFRWVLLT